MLATSTLALSNQGHYHLTTKVIISFLSLGHLGPTNVGDLLTKVSVHVRSQFYILSSREYLHFFSRAWNVCLYTCSQFMLLHYLFLVCCSPRCYNNCKCNLSFDLRDVNISFFLRQEFCVFLCPIGLALGVFLSMHLRSLYKERVVFSLHLIICWESASKMFLRCNIMSTTVPNWRDSSWIQ